MRNLKLSYPYEKFMTAISSMATSDRSLKERIHSAYMSFHTIRDGDLKGEIGEKYSELMILLREVKDGPEENGYVLNSLNAATPEKLEKMADLIYEIFMGITSEYFGHGE